MVDKKIVKYMGKIVEYVVSNSHTRYARVYDGKSVEQCQNQHAVRLPYISPPVARRTHPRPQQPGACFQRLTLLCLFTLFSDCFPLK